MPAVTKLELDLGISEELEVAELKAISPEVISSESSLTEDEEDCRSEEGGYSGSATSPLVRSGSLEVMRGSSIPVAETPSASHADSETNAEMPRTAASPVLVATDHSRFFSTLHFLMFIIK